MRAAFFPLILLVFTTSLTLSAPLAVQAAEPSNSNAPATLKAELTHGIDAHSAKVGDPILARCMSNFVSRGAVRIPKNAKLIGHVADVQRKTRGNHESMLRIVFDRAVMRDGREIRLAATIQAIAPPAMMTSESDESTSGGSQNPAKMQETANTGGDLPEGLHDVSATGTPAASSRLTANATSVIGLKGLELDTAASSSENGSVIRSSSENVRLESGTRLILRVSVQ